MTTVIHVCYDPIKKLTLIWVSPYFVTLPSGGQRANGISTPTRCKKRAERNPQAKPGEAEPKSNLAVNYKTGNLQAPAK